MTEITTVGLDLAKTVFQVHGADKDGRPVVRKKLRRGQVLGFFAGLPPCLIGLEACASAHYWARGHCHVWTAPFVQGLILTDADLCGLRSCVRPVVAVHMTAGPDEVRVPGPNQTNGLRRPDNTSGCPGCGSV